MEIVNRIGNVTKVFAKTFENEAKLQIEELCNFEPYLESKIRIMPDAHAGKGCTVGTTMTIIDKITPNLVGVDIGCGMLTIELGCIDLDLSKLDEVVSKHVPSGFNTHQKPMQYFDFREITCKDSIDIERAWNSIGTLGGGNHFIEIAKSETNGWLYLIIHSGSRKLGKDICEYHQKVAGSSDLSYLFGDKMGAYLYDMRIAQEFAQVNREEIAKIIIRDMGIENYGRKMHTIHNYIDFDRMILRKGAVSANYGERLLIPINMRDGSLLCRGKGNADWNFSAPHGAGRLMSRSKAKKILDMENFKSGMDGIYTSSICEATIDEAPMAYKPMQEIIDCISDAVEVIDILKPIYNFKAH